MKSVFLVFPHQLFKDIQALQQAQEVYLIEEFLFFNQYKFHKQKLVLHRASMQYYRQYLNEQGVQVTYVEATTEQSDVRVLLTELHHKGVDTIHYYDVCDHWLEKRIANTCKQYHITQQEHPTLLFINTKDDLKEYFDKRTTYFQTDFYIQQRKKLRILLDEQGKPHGGKWSFDADNRLKYPKNKTPPSIAFPQANSHYNEAITYVQQHYANNYGTLSRTFIYPTTHEQSEAWLQQFIEHRLHDFGAYEDAIVDDEHILHHSVLTPMLNIGLLTPLQIVHKTREYATHHSIPLNSLEGFIRQIIGWREFIRGVYHYKGTQERTTNFWQFHKDIPASFYTASTGIKPLDMTIQKLLSTAYNHHIERLMIVGNFMLLCEFHPDNVYQWFMEMYIDAYDWVMVPNVYGMSQFADGGIMATKPYISGSSYVLKMSNYGKGAWCAVWDALFWHFMNKHRTFFLSNPRLGMLIKTYDKMSTEKKANIQALVETLQL